MTLFEPPSAGGDELDAGPRPDPLAVESTIDSTASVAEGAVESIALRLVVAYDGARFHGFARQPGARTVGGVLAEALSAALRQPVELVCAGRTDAGVHAWGQVVTLTAPADAALDTARIGRIVTRRLGPEVVVRDVAVVAPDFDARRSADWRRYRYTICNRPAPDPFLARTAWWVDTPLDIRALRLAADPFIGEHDYAAFCRKGPEGSSSVRRVYESRWVDQGDGILRYEVRASAFCWQMVRSMVGLLVEVGRGRLRPGDVLGVLRSRDRNRARVLAPAHGLSLWEVGYDGWTTEAVGPGFTPRRT